MTKIKCVKGQMFGDVEFIEEIPSSEPYQIAKFLCPCGNIFITRVVSVKSGHSTSCGCKYKRLNAKHGDSFKANVAPLYKLWAGMIQRCINSNQKNYKNYGGRGIKVYEEWVESYAEFKKWILTNIGDKPQNMSLDRIDNDKGYFPGNLRWATRYEQALNSRITTFTKDDIITIRYLTNCKFLSLKETATLFKVSYATINKIVNRKTHTF